MSFSQHLVLWLHVAFVIFTIGPVTLAIMSTPRYIRKRDTRILRYLTRMTFVFGIASLGVLIAGFALASMIGKDGKPWVIISATLFVVAVLLLGLIHRDQRHAIKAIEAATSGASAAPAESGASTASGHADATEAAGTAEERTSGAAAQPPRDQEATSESPDSAGAHRATEQATGISQYLANVERGRIAMMGGVVSLIWLVILVLMVWNT
jgi:uncharacterized membrane protein